MLLRKLKFKDKAGKWEKMMNVLQEGHFYFTKLLVLLLHVVEIENLQNKLDLFVKRSSFSLIFPTTSLNVSFFYKSRNSHIPILTISFLQKLNLHLDKLTLGKIKTRKSGLFCKLWKCWLKQKKIKFPEKLNFVVEKTEV